MNNNNSYCDHNCRKEINGEEGEMEEEDYNTVDPLDFIDKGLSFDGPQDYEALAAKKRKALQIHHHPYVTTNRKLEPFIFLFSFVVFAYHIYSNYV